jgi:feruloyl-CoA synthase
MPTLTANARNCSWVTERDRPYGTVLTTTRPERKCLIVASNSIDHAMTALAAMRIGVPVCVVSPTLVATADQLSRFRTVVATLTPGAVYIDSTVKLDVLRVLGLAIPILAASTGADRVTPINDLPRRPRSDVQAAFDSLSTDAPAKILFTSGSTGTPKGVIITQRMMCSNVAGLAAVWPFLLEHPPVLLDWLPWSHIFGGNCCFNLALYYGGSFYIDDGRPIPAAVSRTVENLQLISPNVYFNVPVGYDALLPLLEEDERFARRFFAPLYFLFNAAVALPASTRKRLEAVALKSIGRCPPFIGGWGSTETSSFATVVCFETPYTDNLGIPMPGTTIKMVPNEDKFELRVKGPNVTPGYWREPISTEKAFDEDGYYRIGDAGRLADPRFPNAGIRFCGRIAENFKLTSGTWVNVGALRIELVDALRPYVDDIVITGHGRSFLGVLVFPSLEACRRLVEPEGALEAVELAQHPAVVAAIHNALYAHWLTQRGSSTRIERFSIMHIPPSRADRELTDKGSINQAAVLVARQAQVEALYRVGHRVCESQPSSPV